MEVYINCLNHFFSGYLLGVNKKTSLGSQMYIMYYPNYPTECFVSGAKSIIGLNDTLKTRCNGQWKKLVCINKELP